MAPKMHSLTVLLMTCEVDQDSVWCRKFELPKKCNATGRQANKLSVYFQVGNGAFANFIKAFVLLYF